MQPRVIKCNQIKSNVIKCDQIKSNVIKCNQIKSKEINWTSNEYQMSIKRVSNELKRIPEKQLLFFWGVRIRLV